MTLLGGAIKKREKRKERREKKRNERKKNKSPEIELTAVKGAQRPTERKPHLLFVVPLNAKIKANFSVQPFSAIPLRVYKIEMRPK